MGTNRDHKLVLAFYFFLNSLFENITHTYKTYKPIWVKIKKYKCTIQNKIKMKSMKLNCVERYSNSEM